MLHTKYRRTHNYTNAVPVHNKRLGHIPARLASTRTHLLYVLRNYPRSLCAISAPLPKWFLTLVDQCVAHRPNVPNLLGLIASITGQLLNKVRAAAWDRTALARKSGRQSFRLVNEFFIATLRAGGLLARRTRNVCYYVSYTYYMVALKCQPKIGLRPLRASYAGEQFAHTSARSWLHHVICPFRSHTLSHSLMLPNCIDTM